MVKQKAERHPRVQFEYLLFRFFISGNKNKDEVKKETKRY